MKQTVALIVLATTLLLSADVFAASDYIEYNININKDGSAFWTITQVTNINSPVDSWEEFERRLLSIIETAKNSTSRDMALDWTSLEMSTKIHWETSSKTIVYMFCWQNFSIIKEGQISFGDVFSKNFFSLLYGNGELHITYPAEYIVSSISFRPNKHDDTTHTLHWYRTQDFLVGDQTILLVAKNSGANESSLLFEVAVLSSGGLGAVATGFLIFKRRKKQKEAMVKLGTPNWRESESDQEKILKLIRSAGGNLKQAEICDKLRFSRAKTSLLLAEMEKNSLVERRKNGKNKIVFTIENKES